jgi:hypothetical protein
LLQENFQRKVKIVLEKIKKVFAVLGACAVSVAVALFFRSRSDGRRSERNASGNGSFRRGVDEGQEALRLLGEETDKLGEHIERAKSILRGAIERSEEGQCNSLDGSGGEHGS